MGKIAWAPKGEGKRGDALSHGWNWEGGWEVEQTGDTTEGCKAYMARWLSGDLHAHDDKPTASEEDVNLARTQMTTFHQHVPGVNDKT